MGDPFDGVWACDEGRAAVAAGSARMVLEQRVDTQAENRG